MGSSVSHGDAQASTVLMGCKPHACLSASSIAKGHGDDNDEPMVCGDDPILPVASSASCQVEERPRVGRGDSVVAGGNLKTPQRAYERHQTNREQLPIALAAPVSYSPDVGYLTPATAAPKGEPRAKSSGRSSNHNTQSGAETGHKPQAHSAKKTNQASTVGQKRPASADPPVIANTVTEPKATSNQGGCPGKCKPGRALLPGQIPGKGGGCPLGKVTEADVKIEFKQPTEHEVDPLTRLSPEERKKVVAHAQHKADKYNKLGKNIEEQCHQQ